MNSHDHELDDDRNSPTYDEPVSHHSGPPVKMGPWGANYKTGTDGLGLGNNAAGKDEQASMSQPQGNGNQQNFAMPAKTHFDAHNPSQNPLLHFNNEPFPGNQQQMNADPGAGPPLPNETASPDPNSSVPDPKSSGLSKAKIAQLKVQLHNIECFVKEARDILAEVQEGEQSADERDESDTKMDWQPESAPVIPQTAEIRYCWDTKRNGGGGE